MGSSPQEGFDLQNWIFLFMNSLPVLSSSSPIIPVPPKPLDEIQKVHTFKVNEFCVNVFRKQNALFYETYHLNQKIMAKGFLYKPKESDNSSEIVAKKIAYIKKCAVQVEEDGVPQFLYIYKTWEKDGFEIKLARGKDALIWNLVDTATNRNSCLPVKACTLAASRCHQETIDIIERIKQNSLQNQNTLSLIEDFEIASVIEPRKVQREIQKAERLFGYNSVPIMIAHAASVLFCPPAAIATGLAHLHLLTSVKNTNTRRLRIVNAFQLAHPEKPLAIEIVPVSKPSLVDDKIRVSKFRWSVTVITYGGAVRYCQTKICKGNHSEIIVEGINDGYFGKGSPQIGEAEIPKIGESFIYKAHNFVGQMGLETGILSSKDLKFETRTEIWMRSSEKVKALLSAIEQQKGHPSSFSRLGRDSVFSDKDADNCFTWIRENLKTLDIDIGKSLLGKLATIPKMFTRPKDYYKFPKDTGFLNQKI